MIALFPTALGFLVFSATRTVATDNVFTRIYNAYNYDTYTQADFADALDHINDERLEAIRQKFNEAIANFLLKHQDRDRSLPLTGTEMEEISSELADALSDLADLHPDLIKETPTSEYIASYAGLIFDISLAIAVGLPAYLTFMQKSFDGVNVIAKLAGYNAHMLNPWLKPILMLIPGAASGMLYFDAGSKFRGVLFELAKHLYHNPKQIVFGALLTAANYLSAYGPENVANGVLKNKLNILGVYTDSTMSSMFGKIQETIDQIPTGKIFSKLSFIGGWAVNGNASTNKAFLDTSKTVDEVELKDISKHLRNNYANISKPESAERINKYDLFLFKTEKAKSENKASLNINDDASQYYRKDLDLV